MMRVAGVLSLVAVALCAAAEAQAQTSSSSAESRGYADLTAAATFGHKSSGSIGGEAGWRIRDDLDVFAELGRMKNVGTQALDDRAALIANAVGATFSAAYKVTYVDFGVRYRWPPTTRQNLTPYAMVGFGVARVTSDTVLSVNGVATPPESFGFSFGNDLSGTVSKGLFTLGFGVTRPFGSRYLLDGSYRYGRVFARSGEIEGDTGINTNRLQIGVGVRF
jgi:opacity protein-like surface antigen